MSLVVAVVGATGLVGREMLRTLERRQFPADRVLALATARSAGQRVPFRDGELTVQEATPERFAGVDVALFSAGRGTSRALAPEAASRGTVVIDNSSAWRRDPEVPLVVPEVNARAAETRPKGIVANPNCSTIQMVVALGPIHARTPLEQVVVSTYQAASGKGQAGVEELAAQQRAVAAGQPPQHRVFPAPLAQNLIMDWPAGDECYSEEELKMVHETRKILDAPDIAVSPTAVRVPVVTGHAEAIYLRCAEPISAAQVRDALREAPGVQLSEGPYVPGRHPQPRDCAGTDWVFVGRVRDDLSVPGTVHLWVVADNLRKGAALNAVQIAEHLFS